MGYSKFRRNLKKSTRKSRKTQRSRRGGSRSLLSRLRRLMDFTNKDSIFKLLNTTTELTPSNVLDQIYNDKCIYKYIDSNLTNIDDDIKIGNDINIGNDGYIQETIIHIDTKYSSEKIMNEIYNIFFGEDFTDKENPFLKFDNYYISISIDQQQLKKFKVPLESNNKYAISRKNIYTLNNDATPNNSITCNNKYYTPKKELYGPNLKFKHKNENEEIKNIFITEYNGIDAFNILQSGTFFNEYFKKYNKNIDKIYYFDFIYEYYFRAKLAHYLNKKYKIGTTTDTQNPVLANQI